MNSLFQKNPFSSSAPITVTMIKVSKSVWKNIFPKVAKVIENF